ncbi:NAD(P)/FAD-dependent oxidoreductase [Candidatus Izimaplasma bacterium]|nr:NAD(P)/FAD-dependent oxidoreductase [Candidatus Izimaplasma bacterium]
MVYDAIVIGGGPAGLMASNVLEKNGKKFLLLEKTDSCGKKVIISGGTRCNVTNNLNVKEFIDALTLNHRRFLYDSLNKFGPKDVIEFFETRRVPLALENNFKYFPESNKSVSVVNALLGGIKDKNIVYNSKVTHVKKNGVFTVRTPNKSYQSTNVIISTGASSFPHTGSTGDGLKLSKRLGIEYSEYTPAETHVYSKYIVNEFKDLQGISIQNVTIKIGGTKIKATGGVIFTHFGLSGPAIMHLSEDVYFIKDCNLIFNLCELSIKDLTEHFNDARSNNSMVKKSLESIMQKRLARVILEHLGIENKPVNQISNKDINKLTDFIVNFKVPIDSVQNKDNSFVNKGGVSVKELNPKTMETKKIEGLFYAGEVADLHGPIGGFNVTIALSTGYKAANSIR